jgi:hypothetical protein
MAKKVRITRIDVLNELKSLESKWLKDPRLYNIEPIQAKVIAAKAAALLEHIELKKLTVDVTLWPLHGIEELVKLDEGPFKQALIDLQNAGVINSSFRFRKAAAALKPHERAAPEHHEEGALLYRCAKPGGVNLSDRDEYIAEDQEIEYTEEDISASPDLQNAIASEWLVRVEKKAN